MILTLNICEEADLIDDDDCVVALAGFGLCCPPVSL